MPQLEDKWQHDTWFDDLLKADKLHEKISLNELRCILVDFIKEVKDKHDIQYVVCPFLKMIQFLHQVFALMVCNYIM